MTPYPAQLVHGECHLRDFLSSQLADGLRNYG